ncbi:MAG: RDD family protein [Gammaproteobacteria bacterium]
MNDKMRATDSGADAYPDIQPVPTGFFRRLGVIFYDSILLFAVLFFSVGLLMIAVNNEAVASGNPFMTAFVLLVSLLFFGWFWTHGGQTLGMQTWRVKIESADGGPVSLKQAVIHFAASLLSWSALGLGFLWILLDSEKCAWHDRLAGTRLRHYPKPSKAAKPGQ